MTHLELSTHLAALFGNISYSSVRSFRFAARRFFDAHSLTADLLADGTFDAITVGLCDDLTSFFSYSDDN